MTFMYIKRGKPQRAKNTPLYGAGSTKSFELSVALSKEGSAPKKRRLPPVLEWEHASVTVASKNFENFGVENLTSNLKMTDHHLVLWENDRYHSS